MSLRFFGGFCDDVDDSCLCPDLLSFFVLKGLPVFGFIGLL